MAVLLSGTIYFSISYKIKLGILENWFGAHLWEKRLKRWRAGMGRDGTGRDLRVSELAAVLSSYVNISRYYVYSVQENVHVSWSGDRRFRALRISILNDILYISLNCKVVLVHNRSPEHGLLRYYLLFLQGEPPRSTSFIACPLPDP